MPKVAFPFIEGVGKWYDCEKDPIQKIKIQWFNWSNLGSLCTEYCRSSWWQVSGKELNWQVRQIYRNQNPPTECVPGTVDGAKNFNPPTIPSYSCTGPPKYYQYLYPQIGNWSCTSRKVSEGRLEETKGQYCIPNAFQYSDWNAYSIFQTWLLIF